MSKNEIQNYTLYSNIQSLCICIKIKKEHGEEKQCDMGVSYNPRTINKIWAVKSIMNSFIFCILLISR